MSDAEIRRVPTPTIDVQVGTIEERGNPTSTVIPHDPECGGILSYGQGPLVASWNGNHLEAESVWAYRCTNACGVTLLLPEVSAVIERHIDEARGQANQAGIAQV